MIVTPFSEDRPRTFHNLLCDGCTLSDVEGYGQWMEMLRGLQARHPHHRILCSLDDLDQAGYTSGHATDRWELDSIEGHDLSALGPECFSDGEHHGYLSTEAEFPIRLANLIRHADGTRMADFAGKLYRTTEFAGLVNCNPGGFVLSGAWRIHVVQFVPVASSAHTLAAFPNGYFTHDLSVRETFALSAHLEARYGLELFGVGASLLGFWRAQPLNDLEAHRVARDLAALDSCPQPDAAVRLGWALAGSTTVFVPYSDFEQ
jgi:hypothetical protein